MDSSDPITNLLLDAQELMEDEMFKLEINSPELSYLEKAPRLSSARTHLIESLLKLEAEINRARNTISA
jgi:hypothetical protein